LEDRHRWRVLMRGPSSGALHTLLGEGLTAFERVHEKSKVQITVDVDPVDLL
jgi:primosomal protein N'